jgi:DNA-3-methyladenine glycosylase
LGRAEAGQLTLAELFDSSTSTKFAKEKNRRRHMRTSAFGKNGGHRASILSASFYDRDPAVVARELIGARLVRESAAGLTAGWIVEVEAYLCEDDPACHAARGKTRRNATMFGPPGTAYVYMIHSRWCFNVVTEGEGMPSAVLIRAIEPTAGQDLMAQRRGVSDVRELARGPAKLCGALAIDRSFDGYRLTLGEQLWIEGCEPRRAPWTIATSPRIGISAARELPLRFFAADNRFVSRPHWPRRFAGG